MENRIIGFEKSYRESVIGKSAFLNTISDSPYPKRFFDLSAEALAEADTVSSFHDFIACQHVAELLVIVRRENFQTKTVFTNQLS
jgi:hypothetical protein